MIESKTYVPVQEDPLNVMEPRPSHNLSEESLMRNVKSYGEVYEMLLDLNRRVEILEHQLEAFVQRFSLGWLKSLFESPLAGKIFKVL